MNNVLPSQAVLQDCDAGGNAAIMKMKNVRVHEPIAPLGSILVAGAVSGHNHLSHLDTTSTLSTTYAQMHGCFCLPPLPARVERDQGCSRREVPSCDVAPREGALNLPTTAR